jgi:hypothetical protein
MLRASFFNIMGFKVTIPSFKQPRIAQKKYRKFGLFKKA